MKNFRALLILALLAFTSAGAQQDTLSPTGAKELFMGGDGKSTQLPSKAQPGPAKTIGKPQVLGIQTTIYQVFSDGGSKAVSPSTVFRGGDRIRVGFNVNRPGYIYLVNVGTSGKITTLFPAAGTDNNFVQPGLVYQIPQQAGKSMKFDTQPGEETLLVVLSETRIGDVEFSGQTISIGPQSNSNLSQNLSLTKNVTLADASGAKDLVLEDDGVFQTAAFIPNSDSTRKSRPLSIVLKLKHQ